MTFNPELLESEDGVQGGEHEIGASPSLHMQRPLKISALTDTYVNMNFIEKFLDFFYIEPFYCRYCEATELL